MQNLFDYLPGYTLNLNNKKIIITYSKMLRIYQSIINSTTTRLMYLVLAAPQLNSTREEVRDFIKQNKHQIDKQDNAGNTALILACMGSRDKNTEMVAELLIEEGANLDIQTVDECKWTALMFSCRYSHTWCSINIVKKLISAGANVNLQDSCGYPVLMILLSCKIHTQETIEIIKLLIDVTPDLNLIINDLSLFEHIFNNLDNDIIKYCLEKHPYYSDIQLLNSIKTKGKIELLAPYLMKFYYKKLSYDILLTKSN